MQPLDFNLFVKWSFLITEVLPGGIIGQLVQFDKNVFEYLCIFLTFLVILFVIIVIL